jgi:hypothetical protein
VETPLRRSHDNRSPRFHHRRRQRAGRARCRAGRNLDAIAKLYSPKAVRIAPVGSEAMPAEMTGIDSIRQKNEWWLDNYDVNSAEVNGPL